MTAWLRRALVFLGLTCYALPAVAQETAAPTVTTGGMTPMAVVDTSVYSIMGLIILLVGFKVFDLFTPYKLHKELAEDQNVAIGVMVAGLFIALAIVIASAIV